FVPAGNAAENAFGKASNDSSIYVLTYGDGIVGITDILGKKDGDSGMSV
nr:hypothetical protein [Candidatus Bathyarchaeota archaeon]